MYIDDAALPAAPVPAQGELVDWAVLADRRRRQLLEASADLDPYVQAGHRRARRRPARRRRLRPLPRRTTDGGRRRCARAARRAQPPPRPVPRRAPARRRRAAGRRQARPRPARSAAIRPATRRWAHGDLFAPGMTVGAPPDEFFGDGQDWGFPPQLPGAGRRSGHACGGDLVGSPAGTRRCCASTTSWRSHRLWWIPDGMGAQHGAYVRYPREELLAVIAAEAARTATTIVGENLGTVPEEVSRGARPLGRARHVRGAVRAVRHTHGLPPIPARSVAGIRTHDMPAFAAAFDGDADRRARTSTATPRRRRRPPGRRRRRPTCSTPPSSGSPRATPSPRSSTSTT